MSDFSGDMRQKPPVTPRRRMDRHAAIADIDMTKEPTTHVRLGTISGKPEDFGMRAVAKR